MAVAIAKSLTPEIKKKMSVGAKKRWDNRSLSEKEEFSRKSHQGIRKAAQHGSKLENFLYSKLIEEGFCCVAHEKHLVNNDKMHIDLLLPQEQIAIEVDGITHQEKVWSELSYQNKMTADAKKNGLLISAGYDVIRIKYSCNLSRADMININNQLISCINNNNLQKYQEIIYGES